MLLSVLADDKQYRRALLALFQDTIVPKRRAYLVQSLCHVLKEIQKVKMKFPNVRDRLRGILCHVFGAV